MAMWLLIVLTTVGAWATQNLPFQEKTELSQTGSADYTWQFDGSDGLVLQYDLSASQFDCKQLPDTLSLAIELKDPLARNWRVEKVVMYEDEQRSVHVGKDEQPAQYPPEDRFIYRYELFELTKPRYYLSVYLHPRQGSNLSRRDAQALIETERADDKAVRIFVEPPK